MLTLQTGQIDRLYTEYISGYLPVTDRITFVL